MTPNEEDYGVTGNVEGWWSTSHRTADISRCANGFIVSYRHVVDRELPSGKTHKDTVVEKRVFHTWIDVANFLRVYFSDTAGDSRSDADSAEGASAC